MSAVHDAEALRSILAPVKFERFHRIIPGEHHDTPLGMGITASRVSSPSDDYAVLYAAETVGCAVYEAIERGRLDRQPTRTLPRAYVEDRHIVELRSIDTLQLLDPRGERPRVIGVPTDAVGGSAHHEGQVLSESAYGSVPEADGFLYPSRHTTRLCVPENEVRALIGPNGAGKSTFTSLVCGRVEPSAGRVVFDGRDITGLPAHERIRLGIAYTFQITSVFANLPVHEHVALAVRRSLASLDAGWRERRRQTVRRVTAALERVGLAERRTGRAGDMAYGHQRLLEIAMGLAQRPRLFIIDEPTRGLALDEIECFKTLVRELAGSTTILLIEHNTPVVMETADRISVLDAGRLLVEQRIDTVLQLADRAVLLENGRLVETLDRAALDAAPERLAQHLGV